MSIPHNFAPATLTVVDGAPGLSRRPLRVHFNPATLQLTLSNELKDNNRGSPTQYVAKATAKLKMELVFDTTGTGESVLRYTTRLQSFVVPTPSRPASRQRPAQTPPPKVKFEWGAVAFEGIAEAYQETLDFFSADGVPLRSTVQLTLSQKDKVFEDRSGRRTRVGSRDGREFTVTTGAASPADLAGEAGAPAAARQVADANEAESLRAPADRELAVGAPVDLGGPVGFAVGGGAGIGLGLGGGASAGAGLSVGAGFSAAAGLSAEAGLAGGMGVEGGLGLSAGADFSVSAGAVASGRVDLGVGRLATLSATEGAFAGLRVESAGNVRATRLDPELLNLRPGAELSLATDAGAGFRVGGCARFEGEAGLRTDVGGGGAFSGRLTFRED